MQFNRDKHKHFETFYAALFNTLPSSGGSFSSANALDIYNGSYTAGDMSSYGSYYNGRVANALTKDESIIAKDYTENLCQKGWTLPTHSQNSTIENSYSSTWNIVHAGMRLNGGPYSIANGFWWSRTANVKKLFYNLYGNSSTGLKTSDDSYMNDGQSLRCVAR